MDTSLGPPACSVGLRRAPPSRKPTPRQPPTAVAPRHGSHGPALRLARRLPVPASVAGLEFSQDAFEGRDYFGPIDYAALYWHIVDLIWIFLFPLLYLIH